MAKLSPELRCDTEYKTTREGNAKVGGEVQYIIQQVLILRKKEDLKK